MGADLTAVVRRGRAMGADLVITVVGPDHGELIGIADASVAHVAQLERLWSRFRVDSEVSTLNAANGEWMEVSADTRLLLQRAIEAWRISGGFVDCTLLNELIAAGYDRSFEQLGADRPECVGAHEPVGFRPVTPTGYAGPTDIDLGATAARLPPGLGFDPGGIGKGLAADLVTEEVMARGAAGVCIDIGGDLRVRGTGPRGGGWAITVDHPHRGTLATVGVADGAVASSTTLRRTWSVAGEERHHLIDPRTGRPCRSGIEFCTAMAADAWRAEAMAKATLMRGGTHPFDLVDGSGIEVLIVCDDGTVSATDGFGRFRIQHLREDPNGSGHRTRAVAVPGEEVPA